MSQLSNRFALIHSTILNTKIPYFKIAYLPYESIIFSCRNKVTFEQVPEFGDSGLAYNITFRAATSDIRLLQYNFAKMPIALLMTDETVRIIGTSAEPPTIIVIPHESTFEISVSYKTPFPIVL